MPKAEQNKDPRDWYGERRRNVGEPRVVSLSTQRLEEFKKLYEKEFGETLSGEDAYEKAHNLVRLFDVIYRPIPVVSEQKFRALEKHEPQENDDRKEGDVALSGK
jgi:hypothetical protein